MTLTPTSSFRQTKILQQRKNGPPLNTTLPNNPGWRLFPRVLPAWNLFRRIECSATAPRNRYLARWRARNVLQRRVNSAATIETRHGYDPRIIYTGFRRGERRRARVRELHPLPAALRDRQTLENRFISSGGWVNASGGDSKRLGPVSNIYTRYTRFLFAWQGKIEREREREEGRKREGGGVMALGLHCVCSVGIITKCRLEVFRVFVLRSGQESRGNN